MQKFLKSVNPTQSTFIFLSVYLFSRLAGMCQRRYAHRNRSQLPRTASGYAKILLSG